jgi:uncharacterized membrane protein
MSNTYVKAMVLGAITGMRSMSALMLVSHKLGDEKSPLTARRQPFKLLAAPAVGNVLKVLAAAEIIADKTAVIPNRISPAPLATRTIAGAFCGALVCASEGKRADLGGAIGGLSAVASAYAVYHLRGKICEVSGLPDFPVALAEDTIVMTAGLGILKNE